MKQDIIEMEKRSRQIEQDMKTAQGQKLEDLMGSYARLNHEFE